MAYISMITDPRELTEAEGEQLTTYITAQVTAGTTNGNLYTWALAVVPGPDPAPAGSQNVRMWSTSESATGYQTILAGFSPAVSVSVY